MGITVRERVTSRAQQYGLQNRAQIELVATCTSTDVDNAEGVAGAMATFLSVQFPTGYQNWFQDDLQINTDDGIVFVGTATYRSLQDDLLITFETTGGTAHITQSLATISSHAAPGFTAPDFQGAIGVTKDSVEGVDIISRTFRWTETYLVTPSFVSSGFIAAAERLTGRVNNAAFRGRATGEVLFEGLRGARRGYGPWELSFAFQSSRNATGLVVGAITGIDKKGWEYLWVRHMDVQDPSAQMIVKRPIAAFVERVYPSDNFADLGIGT